MPIYTYMNIYTDVYGAGVLSTLQFFIELHQLTGDEEEGDGDNIIGDTFFFEDNFFF